MLFAFEVAHKYKILRGIVEADDMSHAENKILNQEWKEIIRDFDADVYTEEYEVLDIWKLDIWQ